MTSLAQFPTPPIGFAGTVRYAIRARDKRDYSGVLPPGAPEIVLELSAVE